MDSGPEESECGCCLLGDDAVSEESEEVDSAKSTSSQRHPINHATNAGLRESRGEEGVPLEDSAPGGDVSGARGPERHVVQACSDRGRAFRAAVSSEWLPDRQSLAVGVAHCTAALGSMRSPLLPRWPGPPFSPSDAQGVGHTASTGHWGYLTVASVSVVPGLCVADFT